MDISMFFWYVEFLPKICRQLSVTPYIGNTIWQIRIVDMSKHHAQKLYWRKMGKALLILHLATSCRKKIIQEKCSKNRSTWPQYGWTHASTSLTGERYPMRKVRDRTKMAEYDSENRSPWSFWEFKYDQPSRRLSIPSASTNGSSRFSWDWSLPYTARFKKRVFWVIMLCSLETTDISEEHISPILRVET